MEPKDSTTDQTSDIGQGNVITRRNNKGCKSKDFYDWPEQPFEEMDSPLAVQQYIQQLINRNPADIDEILRLPEGQDLGAWKIEHLRMFCMQLNRLAARLQDCCYPETCNQMTATEQWIFLCAAHKQPNECPAIDYTRHALDSAASLLNSNKYFPSRVTIKESSVTKLSSVCRRLYRIFSHAYYHHFQVFDEFEKETHLCGRFSRFVTMYELLSKDSLIVPSDGSKPDLESEPKISAQQIDVTMIDNGVGVKEVVTSTFESVESSGETVSKKAATPETITAEVKTETKPKVEEKTATATAPTNRETISPKAPSTWSSSQASTNTMVKSSSKAAEPITGVKVTTTAASTPPTTAAKHFS